MKAKTPLHLKHPTRDGYTFSGWDKDFDHVTENLTVTAIYEKKVGTGLEDVSAKFGESRKLLRDGVIYIERNGKIYDLNGRMVE